MSLTILKNIGTLVCISDNRKSYLLSHETQDLKILNDVSIIFDEKIKWIGKEINSFLTSEELSRAAIIDCTGKTVFPGFTDPHTHYPFAGNRAAEFAERLSGVSYEEIARKGGGIQNTVAATKDASIDLLKENVLKRARIAASFGITSIEMKSGYSLTVDGELNQLRAIKAAQELMPLEAIPTLLAAHDFPKELKQTTSGRRKYIDTIINDILPIVKEENLAEYNDVFIDEGYYTVAEGIEVLQAGIDIGIKPRAHCDELVDTGSSQAVAEIGGISVDHLIRINDEGIKALESNGTVACLLPGTSYFIRKPYAPARKILDSGVITTIATDCNPGSSYTENLQLIMQLACINGGMYVNEAIAAVTLNSAYAVGRNETKGSIEIGKNADFAIMDIESPEEIIYHHGVNHCVATYAKGKLVWSVDSGPTF